MSDCFMIRNGKPRAEANGGGNNITRSNVMKIRRTAALGDSLCATIVADKLIRLGVDVVFQAHSAAHCLLRRHPLLAGVEEPNGHVDVNLDGSYETNGRRRFLHFHQMFLESANQQLAHYGIRLGEALNCKPRIYVSEQEKQWARDQFQRYERPWVFICPRSDSYNVRQVPDGIWQEAAMNIKGTKFWLGRHPAPVGIVDLHANHMDHVLLWLSVADLLITVDTGPMHVAAAMGVPVVAISQSSSPELHLSDQCDYVAIAPHLDCLNCQQNLCPKEPRMPPCQQVDPKMIAAWANGKLRAQLMDGISAVVPIYQPDSGTLRHCLENLIPQVDEIIVTAEMNSRIPSDAFQHPKIRYVRKGLAGIGYGRNANFGVRHTTHRNILLLNDDVFLNADAVGRMKECLKPGVGMVSNLLRYPEGTIYHAGKARGPGQRGWGHRDYRQMDCTIKEPTEMENVCGACVMVTRKSFYEIDGFDEEFFLFGEDDDFALKMRRQGYKIMFTPHSEGIHMEHQSVKKIADIGTLVSRANATFHHKWGNYLEHNLNRIPGNFDY